MGYSRLFYAMFGMDDAFQNFGARLAYLHSISVKDFMQLEWPKQVFIYQSKEPSCDIRTKFLLSSGLNWIMLRFLLQNFYYCFQGSLII